MRILLGITLLFSIFLASGQVGNLSKEDTQANARPELKIYEFLQRSTYYNASQLDSSLFYVNKASAIAKNLKNDSIDAKIRAHKGGLLVIAKRFDEAEKLLYQNIETSDIDLKTLGSTYNNLGNSFNVKEDFEKATVNYLKAVEILETLKDTTVLGKAYANLGVIHARLKNYPKAIFYMDKGMNFAGKNDALKMTLALNLSGIYHEEKELDKAISTSFEAEQLAKKIKATSALAAIYSNLCRFYLDKDEFETSISYGRKALELKKSMNQNISIVLNNLGYASLQNGEKNTAFSYLSKALPTAVGETKSLVYSNLSKTLNAKGDYKNALRYANLHIKIRDSLNLLAQQNSVSELTEKYESEKKQQQLDLLNTTNELNQNRISNQRNYIWALALFSFLAILVGFLLYRNQKTNQSLRTTKIQHRLLQAQLNPHFLFNALNSIQAFGYANNREKLANYISSFSKLMRSILESSDQDFISIEEDAQTLNEYLYLQRLSKEKAFETNVVIDPNLDFQILIPPMFTQPFVENAVLHGVKNKNDGRIHVRYSQKNNKLLVEISDNGEGLDSNSKNEDKLHRSMGMDIMKDRVTNLQKANNYKCEVAIDSGKTGTTVRLTFPKRFKKLG